MFPLFFFFFFLLFPVLLQPSCFSLRSCFHMSPLSPALHILLVCLEFCQPCLLFHIPQVIVYDGSCTQNHSPSLFHYPSTHLACFPITHVFCCTWHLTEACSRRVYRQQWKPRQLGEQSSRWRYSPQWSFPNPRKVAVKLEGDGSAVRCSELSRWDGVLAIPWNNVDVLESERFSLESVHFSTNSKSLSKLILMKWAFVKVEITLIKIMGSGKASETISQLHEWSFPPHSLASFFSSSKQFSFER